MISVLHCRVFAFFSLYLTLLLFASFLKVIYKGFVFLVIVQFSRYRCAFYSKCSSIISHFFGFVKRFLKYFLFLFLFLSLSPSGDLFILPLFSPLVKPFFDVLCFAQKLVLFFICLCQICKTIVALHSKKRIFQLKKAKISS